MNHKTFTLLSSELGGMASIDQVSKFAGGHEISPQLSWINAPEGTKSFAVTIYDQIAPTGGGFWHWLVFNIPARIQNLPSGCGNPEKNLLPSGAIQSKNDTGNYGYCGPCPPIGHGFHLYLITVYALNVESLDMDKDSLANQIGFQLYEHTIEKASMVMYYKR